MVNISFTGFQHHPRVVCLGFSPSEGHGSGNTGAPQHNSEPNKGDLLPQVNPPRAFVVKKSIPKKHRRVGNSPLNGGESMQGNHAPKCPTHSGLGIIVPCALESDVHLNILDVL